MRSFLRVLSITLLIAWMGFIFYMSAQPAGVSSEISGGVIELVAQRLYPDFENLSLTEKAEVVASFQFAVRKSAHVAGFALLGVLSFLSFISYTKLRFFTRVFWAGAISALYAASDEIHQRFVSGRSCELRDFLLDSAGVLGAILLCTAFVKVIRPLRRKTAYSGKGKKALKALNKQLFEKLDDATANNNELQKKLALQESEIKRLSASVLEKTAEIVQIKTEKEEILVQPENEIKLSDEMEYAAKIIGEAVIEVTKTCNYITEKGGDNTKELVNLALGRNEVLKTEIFKILGLAVSFDEKQELIQKEKQEAFDYFNSIKAQMC